MFAQISRFCANNRIYHRYLLCWHTSVIHGWKALDKVDFFIEKSFGLYLILSAQGIFSSRDLEAYPLAYTASYIQRTDSQTDKWADPKHLPHRIIK
jgi:hypothetical protein